MLKTKSNLLKLSLLSILSFLLFSGELLAGYKYLLEDTGSNKESTEIWVEGDMMKMALEGESNSELIYDGANEKLLIIEHGRKSYMSLGKEEIEAISNKLNEAMAMMEEQLASVPPVQRQMMEKMMKQHMPKVAEKAAVTMTRTGKKESIAGYDVEKVDMSIGSQGRSELWVVDWSNIEGGEVVSTTMMGMTGLFKDFMDAMSKGLMAGMFGDSMFDQIDKLNGFPVRTDEYDKSGNLVKQITLVDIEKKSIDASEFKVPSGYKKQKMDF